MRARFALITAATALVVFAGGGVPAGAAASSNSVGPGAYETGPKSGDASTFTEADPQSGKVVIFQHNTRQAAAVNCTGQGPRATLLATHPATDGLSSVVVAYKDALLSDHEVVMDVLVQGERTGVLGHRTAFGPMNNESGIVEVPLRRVPEPGETVTTTFGLQTGQGCLPHPYLLGLDGSRLVNGGQATFTDVSFGQSSGTEQRVVQRPEDQITGQDHPADVFVEGWQYVPATVTIKAGQSLKFGNYDMFPYGAGVAGHSLEEAIPGCTSPPYKTNTGCDRPPRFTTGLTDHGYVHKVEGVEKLPPGRYPFTCQVHSQMTGVLVVQ